MCRRVEVQALQYVLAHCRCRRTVRKQPRSARTTVVRAAPVGGLLQPRRAGTVDWRQGLCRDTRADRPDYCSRIRLWPCRIRPTRTDRTDRRPGAREEGPPAMALFPFSLRACVAASQQRCPLILHLLRSCYRRRRRRRGSHLSGSRRSRWCVGHGPHRRRRSLHRDRHRRWRRRRRRRRRQHRAAAVTGQLRGRRHVGCPGAHPTRRRPAAQRRRRNAAAHRRSSHRRRRRRRRRWRRWRHSFSRREAVALL